MNDLLTPGRQSAIRGRFWLSTDPARQRDGQLDLVAGVLETQGELVDCMVVSQESSEVYRRVPLDDIGVEYCLYGVSDSGVKLTVPAAIRGACNDKAEPSPQEFLFLQAHTGAHTRFDDCYRSVMVAWDVLLGNWEGELSVSNADLVRVATDGNGLTLQGISDLTHQQIHRRLIEPVTSMLTTLNGRTILPTQVVLEKASGVRVDVHRTQSSAAVKRSESFFDQRCLQIDHLNRWFALVAKTNPIPSIAARALQASEASLESRTMTLAASVEALHRELHDRPKMDRAMAAEVRDLAANAVPEMYRDRVKAILGSLGTQSFADRVAWWADALGDLATEICGSVSPQVPDELPPRTKWIRAVAKARNSFAHQTPKTPKDLEQYVDQALTRCESLQWFVVACLLVECGLTPGAIAQEFHRKSAYSLFRQRARKSYPEIYEGPSIG